MRQNEARRRTDKKRRKKQMLKFGKAEFAVKRKGFCLVCAGKADDSIGEQSSDSLYFAKRRNK
jgi:hypothetical protein